MYGRDHRYKTADYKDWEAQAFWELSEPKPQLALKELREAFDETKHSIKLSLDIYYPQNIFYNTTKTISSKTIDLSNTEKILLDLLCDSKFHSEALPYGCPNLNLNDKHVIELTSKKHPTSQKTYTMVVEIELVPHPVVCVPPL